MCLERIKKTNIFVYSGSHFPCFKRVAWYCIYDVWILTVTYLSQVFLFAT